MTRARPTPSSFLALVCVLLPACDDQAGVEEVDRGAKPIEARVAHMPWAPGPGIRTARTLEIDDVHLLVTGTVDDAPFVMLATEDGTGVCAMAGEGPSRAWVDPEALAEGRLERGVTHSPADDVDACAVLQQLAPR